MSVVLNGFMAEVSLFLDLTVFTSHLVTPLLNQESRSEI